MTLFLHQNLTPAFNQTLPRILSPQLPPADWESDSGRAWEVLWENQLGLNSDPGPENQKGVDDKNNSCN